MITFPAGFIDHHGLDLSDAIGKVNDLNFSSHSNLTSSLVGTEYDTRNSGSGASLNFRVDVFISEAAFLQGKGAFSFQLNGVGFFSIPASSQQLTAEQAILEAEAHITALLLETVE